MLTVGLRTPIGSGPGARIHSQALLYIPGYNAAYRGWTGSIPMKTGRLLGIALGAAVTLVAAPAWADPPHHARGNGPPPHAGGPHNRDAPPPGWQKKAWRRGDRLPWAEVDRRYWVDDYAHYRLRDPGRGQRWVRQSDTEYLLVEIATGVIIDALRR